MTCQNVHVVSGPIGGQPVISYRGPLSCYSLAFSQKRTFTYETAFLISYAKLFRVATFIDFFTLHNENIFPFTITVLFKRKKDVVLFQLIYIKDNTETNLI